MSDRKNENDEQRDSIYENGIVETKNSRGRIKTLSIIGTIEGHTILPSGTKSTKYEHVLPELVAIEEDEEIDGLLLLLNTVGGDVEAGLAIAELISGMNNNIAIKFYISSLDSNITFHFMNWQYRDFTLIHFYFTSNFSSISKIVLRSIKSPTNEWRQVSNWFWL